MATFASWLHDQGDREDAVGYVAKYWKSVTPGKISAISGVERHLKNIEHDYETQPEGMEEASWRHGQATIAAALNGLKFAVEEYHKQQAVDTAVHHGVRPEDIPVQGELPFGEPMRLAGTGSDLHITARAGEPFDSDPYPAPLPRDDRFAVIEEKLDAVMAQNAALIDMIGTLAYGGQWSAGAETGIDWDALAASADYSAVPE